MFTSISVEFVVKVDCDDDEPSRVVPFVDGGIFDEGDEPEHRIEVGRIAARLLQGTEL
jgi:hypothetical protein